MTSQPLRSAIYDGWVMHRRLAPTHHGFRYHVFALLIDLDELETLSRLWLFAWNRPGVASFHDRDHGDGRDLRGWLDAKLADAGVIADGAKYVLCYPRLFGYVFNPLSVWFCHRSDGQLAATIYEVHNTYGERHAYVLRADNNDATIRQRCAKEFYVSPFLSMDCSYNFTIRPPGKDVLIAINEEEAGKPILTATFSGARKPLSDISLALMILRHPLMTVKVFLAIRFEALRLMWKGVKQRPHGATA